MDGSHEAPSLKGKRRYTHSTPIVVALHPSHGRSCTRLTQTERASACLFTDTWDHIWRNRPCAKLPAHRMKIPSKSQIQLPFGQLANNIPQTPLHSIRSAKAALPAAPIRRRRGSSRGHTAILSLPQYALVDCHPLSAPPPLVTFLWRCTAVSFSHGMHILD
jgi:hypothetical protein